MNILTVCIPQSGHENPLVPIVEAFLACGDRVVVATGPGSPGTLAATGAEMHRAGHGLSSWFDTFAQRVKGAPGDGIRPERINHYFVPRLFAEIAAADMIDDIVEAGKECDADLILFDGYSFAGPLAAAILNIPAVHHMIGPQLADDVAELANDAVSPLWRHFGQHAPTFAGIYDGISLQICPPGLEASRLPGGTGMLMRPSPVPIRPHHPQEEPPLVYITLGTFMGNTKMIHAIIDGLKNEPIRMVVTVGNDHDPKELGDLPEHIRIERFIPQAELLPDCSAVIHHGGSGTMFGALAHGLPQVVIPQGADNYINATLLDEAGVARTIRPNELDAESVRTAVNAVIREPSFADAAQRIASEIADMPDATSVVNQLRSQ